jgi:hypothetical protein
MDTDELFTPEGIEGLERLSELRETHPLTYAIELKRALKEAGEDPGKDFVYKTVQALREERASSAENASPEKFDLGNMLEEEEEEEDLSMADLENQLATLIGEYNQQVEAIRRDERYSDEYRRQALTELYQSTSARHQEIIQRARESAQRRFDNANKRLFSLRLPAGLSEIEAEPLVMSYRDASSRVEAALDKAAGAIAASQSAESDNPLKMKEAVAARLESKSKVLLSLLDQAERSQDERLAEAVFHKASLEGVADVIESYVSSRPEQRKAWERALKARSELEELKSPKSILSTAYSVPRRPPEVPSIAGITFGDSLEGDGPNIVVNRNKELAKNLHEKLTGGPAA